MDKNRVVFPAVILLSFGFEMTFQISTITIEVTQEENGIRLQTDSENIFAVNQTEATAQPIINRNFDIVKNILVPRAGQHLTGDELDELSLKIVLQYFCLYSQWKSFYRHERDRDLTFIAKDLETPMTYDSVIEFVKRKYLKRFREIAATLLGISLAEFADYEKGRKEFMERR